MIGCQADPSIQRVKVGDFSFPLGVYPVEKMSPVQGYSLDFEPADGDDDSGEWEEWPDRYVFDVVLPAERIQPFCRQLFAIFPGRIYPILDILGQDAYREIDPYISYELVGVERFFDALRRYRDFFFEDGMCGFGGMSEEPFFYAFVDEHKIVTIRAEPTFKDRIEKLLRAFDLEQIEEPAGADAAAHEHRGVLLVPSDNPSMLSPGEIVEHLKEEWQLLLNVDPDENVDDEDKPLGVTAWRCVVRCEYEDKPPRYCEVVLHAENLRQAEEVAFDGAEALSEAERTAWQDAVIVAADRLTPDQANDAAAVGKKGKKTAGVKPKAGTVKSSRWLE